MKTYKIKLSVSSINECIKDLFALDEALQDIDELIVQELTLRGLNELEYLYGTAVLQVGNDDYTLSRYYKGNKGKIMATGTSVLYNEFGTGTEGERYSHPMKNEFDLNPYNSGKTIRTNRNADSKATDNNIPVGELYWTFEKNGQLYYTTGTKAGLQMYNTAEYLKKNAKKIAKEVVGDVIRTL